MALYNATDGANWTDNTNWLSQEPVDNWFGVTADADGYVTVLDLEVNNLIGTIPSALGALDELTYLALSRNSLSGSIPGELGNLGNLSVLRLYSNQLSGSIPAEFGNLESLQGLWLGSNDLSGEILAALGDLTSLTKLSLGANDLSGSIPAELGNLENLTSLRFAYNELSGSIPAELGNLESLQELELHGNELSGSIPAELGDLESLQDLWLSNNDLSGSIPATLGNLTNLTQFALSYNDLSGSIPAELGNLVNLTFLYLDGNELSGCVPDALRDVTNNDLADVGLRFCSDPTPTPTPTPTATATPDPANRAALVALYNATDGANWTNKTNWLSAEPVSTWHGVTTDANGRVTQLSLLSNVLSGTIPDLSALTSLTVLDLRFNQLSGSIPSLSALTKLTRLSLDNNELSGSIPSLSTLTDLTSLGIGHNDLSGSIPSLSVLTELTYLNLSDNDLSGSIPSLSSFSKLERLFLYSNRLSGSIPDLSALANVKYLYLYDNQLSGEVFDLGLLHDLKYLSLENNQLSGPVPDLSANVKLDQLDLAGNQFCLPEDYNLADLQVVARSEIESLNLPACTAAEVSAVLDAAQNLAVSKGSGEVTLTWDAVTDAASYELWAWDSTDSQWAGIGGVITGTTYTHSVLTDGRNYLYQVRARDASDERGLWSGREYAFLANTQFPPPPPSRGLDLFYQKHVDVNGIDVVAPLELPDQQMIRAQGIITGMLANRPEVVDTLVARDTWIAIHGGGGVASRYSDFGWMMRTAATDPKCQVFVHELAHVVHFGLIAGADSQDFDPRVRIFYHAARDAGLWSGTYASTNYWEYWAVAATVELTGGASVILPSELVDSTLTEYDPDIAALVVEVFGDVTLPPSCSE